MYETHVVIYTPWCTAGNAHVKTAVFNTECVCDGFSVPLSVASASFGCLTTERVCVWCVCECVRVNPGLLAGAGATSLAALYTIAPRIGIISIVQVLPVSGAALLASICRRHFFRVSILSFSGSFQTAFRVLILHLLAYILFHGAIWELWLETVSSSVVLPLCFSVLSRFATWIPCWQWCFLLLLPILSYNELLLYCSTCHRDSMLTLGVFPQRAVCVVKVLFWSVAILCWRWDFLLTVLFCIATTVPFCHPRFYADIGGFLLTVLFCTATTVSTLPSGPGYANIKVFLSVDINISQCIVLCCHYSSFFATRVIWRHKGSVATIGFYRWQVLQLLDRVSPVNPLIIRILVSRLAWRLFVKPICILSAVYCYAGMFSKRDFVFCCWRGYCYSVWSLLLSTELTSVWDNEHDYNVGTTEHVYITRTRTR